MRRLIYLLLIFPIAFLFVACGEKSIEEQRKECYEQKKRFKVEKKMDFRTGKYEQVGVCY